MLFKLESGPISALARWLGVPVSTAHRWLYMEINSEAPVHSYNLKRYYKAFRIRRSHPELSTEKIAEKVGVSPRTVRRWLWRERGDETVRVIAKHYKKYPEALKLGKEGYPGALIARILGLKEWTVRYWLRKEKERVKKG